MRITTKRGRTAAHLSLVALGSLVFGAATQAACSNGTSDSPSAPATSSAPSSSSPASSATPPFDASAAPMGDANANDASTQVASDGSFDEADGDDDLNAAADADEGNDGNSSSSCTVTYGGTCLTVTSLSAGNDTSFALMSDHSVYGWGSNADEAVGDVSGDQLYATRLPGLANIQQISAYFNHTCAVNSAGNVLCWGTQTNGELGEGLDAPSTGGSETPITVAGVSNAVQVASGGSHTCAVVQSGTVWCWGNNIDGAVGQPRPATGNFTTAAEVPGLTGVARVVAGDDHTCALLQNGTVSCWGNNGSGQLGDGTRVDRFAPVDVGLTGVVEVEAGATQTCARQSNGAISCWGDDGYGQLGDGETTDAGQPNHVTPQVLSGAGVQAMSLGFVASTATVGSQVYVFGSNYWGVFGIFPSPPSGSTTPIAGTLLAGGSLVVLGRTHACGLFGKQVKCWGAGSDGAIGDGTTGGEDIPQVVVWH